MANINFYDGDLIEFAKSGQFDVVVHGCNCFCVMGAGVAKGIKTHFPEAYQADLATKKGDKEKLGTCSYAQAQDYPITIVNAYTQYHYSSATPQVDYDAIRSCLTWVNQQFAGKRILLPKIGAGLAGGDWEVILPIITQTLMDCQINIVQYRK